MSLTDNEIVRAFVCCHIEKLFVDVFNRLQADKEALIAGQETLKKALAEKDKA